jgi:transcriptional regulator with XRE-family HTH domain
MPKRPKTPSVIGARIHRLREKAGISARDLDRLAGITEGHTSLIEAVLGEQVSAQTLAPIARVLGTTLDWLVTGEGAEPSREAVRSAVDSARAA